MEAIETNVAGGASLRMMEAADWPAVAEIYEEGIGTGLATFEIKAPRWEEFDASRLAKPRLVAEIGARVAGWAALSPVSKRECYRGVAEFSIYLSRTFHGLGLGSLLLGALIRESEREGLWTLQATIFPENAASVRLAEKHGFHLVGRRHRIACLRGEWRDTVVYERRSSTVGI